MEKTWEEYWKSFLDSNKLRGLVDEMNTVDNGECKTESICRGVYQRYPEYSTLCEKIREEIVADVENVEAVHLHTSRVKSLDSLLRKVITKRHERLLNKKDPYSKIDEENYQSIITDLVGVRLIMSYRGNWKEMHRHLIKLFPYADDEEYRCFDTVPHKEGCCFLAQIPVANYAKDDDLSVFSTERVKTKFQESGYRSVHYIISYKDVYVELQTRTIYDEAWSDCDHRYVYKHNENRSYSALKELSRVLCGFTNNSNDLGEEMRNVFDSESIYDSGGELFVTSEEEKRRIEDIYDKYANVQNLFATFLNRLSVKGDMNDDA